MATNELTISDVRGIAEYNLIHITLALEKGYGIVERPEIRRENVLENGKNWRE
jgi:hypothetical protein